MEGRGEERKDGKGKEEKGGTLTVWSPPLHCHLDWITHGYRDNSVSQNVHH